MRILALTDLHGRSPSPLLDIPDIDLVLILGDITTGAGLKETANSVNELRKSYSKVYTIPGNWEKNESTSWLNEEGLSIDGKPLKIGGAIFYGLGGSTPTPFHTPREFPDGHYKEVLEGCPVATNNDYLVLVSHTPPYGACDRTLWGLHVGSKSLREFVDLHRPDLLLCGHIHEAKGKMSLGKTLVVNPGPAPSNYAVIELDAGISIKLF